MSLRPASLLLLLLALAPPSAFAGRIAPRLETAAAFRQGQAFVRIAVANRGDVPARNLRVFAAWPDCPPVAAALGTLDRDETQTVHIALGPAPQPPGAHTVLLRLRYTDTAQRPFSVVGSAPLYTGDADPAEDVLDITAAPAALDRETEFAVCVSNRGPRAVAAAVHLHLPDELASDCPARSIELAPAAAAVLRFRLANRGALPGSRYAALAVLDYQTAGSHRSAVAAAPIAIRPPGLLATPAARFALAAVLALAGLFLAAHALPAPARPFPSPALRARLDRLTPPLVLAVLGAFLLLHLEPALLVRDTLAVGGDLPAHNYLASHLREQLFRRGRIVSWAPGWWCGFPMFQYYFSLPYLAVALLSTLIPFNIAFKLVSVSGILLLPPAAWAAARRLRLPAPGPTLLALAMLLLLFDASHTMWGVNIYSTLAGMIANSLSFPLMLLAIAAAWRDADDGRFRLRTAALLALLPLSHFFTSLLAALVIAAFPFLGPRSGTRRACAVLWREGLLALGAAAWWLVPLLAKRSFSVDFGENWPVDFPRRLPPFLAVLSPLILAAAVLGVRRRSRFVAIHAWMLLCALGLFFFGFRHLSPVFVNVRLWPFIVYALLALAAAGAALLLAPCRFPEPALAAALVAALAFGPGRPNHAREWARWNYEGLEAKPLWPVFRDLVLPLRDTPGRLANDLHEDNNAFGSSRIFECVPHLIGKPILEGGIVNSAEGSLFAYYVQSESSRACAGFPPLVRPAAFDIARATAHLRLFNVKHFVARWRGAREALDRHPDWRRLRQAGDWALYELTSHDGRYVAAPDADPAVVRTARPQAMGLEWLYTAPALERPFLLAPPNAAAPAAAPALDEAAFLALLAEWRRSTPPPPAPRVPAVRIANESVTADRISFETTGIGLPHIVRCSWFPNWKVRGAQGVFRVTPNFLLVYPTQPRVELYYGRTPADLAGYALTALAALSAGLVLLARARKR